MSVPQPGGALAALAAALVAERPDDPGRALADVAAIRAEVALLAAAGAGPEAIAALRAGLAGAGLRLLAPADTSLASIQAGLRRLHGLRAVLTAFRVRRRPK